jgi:uncharacterized membrane protein
MTKKDWFGIAYVAAWVMIWGTIGSLIDLPFLNAEIYLAGSVGQVTTFFITALISIIVASLLFPKLLSTRMLAKALGLDTEENYLIA